MLRHRDSQNIARLNLVMFCSIFFGRYNQGGFEGQVKTV